jgi:putative DNA primase/helicase
MIIYDTKTGNLPIVKQFKAAGLNAIPIRTDGSKRPTIYRWKQYQTNQYPMSQCLVDFGRITNNGGFVSKANPPAIGVITGITSGNLEVMDFDLEADTLFPEWSDKVNAQCPGLLDTLAIVQTPKVIGRHVYYRCSTIEGNQKLAMRPHPQDARKPETLIETRGQGGLVVCPGSPPWTHKAKRPYLLIAGDILNIPTITTEQRNIMLTAARSFNRFVEPERIGTHNQPCQSCSTTSETNPRLQSLYREVYVNSNRPGDDYERKATWEEVLAPHDWTLSHSCGDVQYWKRPGAATHSANANYDGSGRLYVFSHNATPFQARKSYSKYQAYTLLNHDGDYHASAVDLAGKGYGKRPQYNVDDFLFGGFDE